MNTFTTANASSTSAEEFRQKIAEVDAMLRHMKAMDFSFQSAIAVEERDEAQNLLNRVRIELFSKLEANQQLVNQISDQLDQYSSDLMDLRDALNEAVNKTRQTEDLNSLNRNHLEETQLKSKEMEKQYGTIQATLRMAKDSLGKISEHLQTIIKAKEESEKLLAQLDGARYPLSEKVKEYTLASNKIQKVELAEQHANLLDELARNLSSIIHGTNQDGFIQRAINASNAYASIIEAVKNAEEAASKALHASDEALKNVLKHNLGDKAKEMKKGSRALEEAAKEEQRKLSGVKGALEAAKNKLAGAEAKKEQLLNQLNSAKNKLGMVHDDASEKIQKAKDTALKANETVAGMEGKLSDMKKKLDEWKKQYGDLRSEDLNQATRDVKNTVSSLESTLPVLLGKLTSLENRRSHNATVLDNILRVRQLISLARNAVSKIKVPVKFNGTSGVQIRTPSNLQDLAAYTSLKFYIQNPDSKKRDKPQDESTRFVLYLGQKDATGDYMGIILKDHKVEWIYKLGNEEPAHLTVDEEIGEQFAAKSANVFLVCRILQYGHMSVTVEKQTLHETKGDSVAKGEYGLFNFRPHNTVLYVGGYPSSFMPPLPLRYPNYRGCIEMDSLNEEVMSLYNFQRTSKSTGDPWLTDGSYFDGTGYAEIIFESQLGSIKRFEQEMRLVSYHGIIFFLKHQASNQLLCLAVRDGKLVLYYDFGGGLNMAPPSRDQATLIVSNHANKAIQLFLLKMGSKDRVLVRLEQSTVFMIEQENILHGATSYYLGGVPTSILPEKLKKTFPKGGSIRGCMKGLKALGKYVDLKRMNTIGIARSVKLHGSGYLTLSLRNVPPLQDFYTGFSFRTSQSRGLLYHHNTKEGSCQVSLQDGHVAVSVLSTELTTKNAYADDTSHYVAIYSDSAGVRMYVDDQLQGSTDGLTHERRQKREAELGVFHLGGLPSSSDLGNLTGCISNVFIKRRSEAQAVVVLQQSTESFNVTMNCPRDRQPQQMRAPEKKSRGKPKVPSKAMLKDTDCHLLKEPRAVKDAFQFGGSPVSRLEFNEIPRMFRERLNSSSGLLFYMANESLGSFFALFVSNGRVVFFSRDRNRVQLVIDGLRSLEKLLPTPVDFGISGPLYVGGAPLAKAKAHIPDASASSFKGCLRHLKLDKKPLNSPSRVFAVTPCYVGPLETGIFFSVEGGYITLDRSVALSQDFEIALEIRPRSSSSLIFHVGKQTDYLRLSTGSQKVTVTANTGTGEFSTSVSQPSLCDGQWHTITVIKGSNMIQLNVDTKGNYTVGPNEVHGTSDKESIYLGGMPELTSQSHRRHPPSFVGCMKNLVINQNQIDIRQAGSTRGSVGLGGCPAG
ncbi:hypothetical protein Chor_004210 [Crotalus horridus]